MRSRKLMVIAPGVEIDIRREVMPRNLLMMIAVAVLALFATAAFAQMVTGTITGTVKDNSGAFVPNARVTVTATDENVVVRTLQTNGSGEYSAPLLPVGRYAVTAEAPKFKRSQQTNITLDVNANLTINFSLQVGSAQETVTVTQPPSEVDTETAQAQTVITSAQINELAVNTRNYEQLVTLMPGVSTGLASDQLYVGASNQWAHPIKLNSRSTAGDLRKTRGILTARTTWTAAPTLLYSPTRAWIRFRSFPCSAGSLAQNTAAVQVGRSM